MKNFRKKKEIFFKAFSMLIINVMLMSLIMPYSIVFASGNNSMIANVDYDDPDSTITEGSTLKGGDVFCIALELESISNPISTITGKLEFDSNKFSVSAAMDFVSGNNGWNGGSYNETTKNFSISNRLTAGSSTAGIVQYIYFTVLKDTPAERIYIKNLEAAGVTGDLITLEDIEVDVGDLNQLPSDQPITGTSFSLSTDYTATTLTAGDTIAVTVTLDSTDADIKAITGALSFDTSILKVSESDEGLYSLEAPSKRSIWKAASSYDDATHMFVIEATTATSTANQNVQIITFEVLQSTDSTEIGLIDLEVAGEDGVKRSATCTTKTIGTPSEKHTVTYDYATNGGTSATKTTAQVSSGSSIDLTPTATKNGWTFVGWNTDSTAKTALTSKTMPSSDTTLYAIYSKNITATLVFYQGATKCDTDTVSTTIYNNETSGTATFSTDITTNLNNTYKNNNVSWKIVGWTDSTTATTANCGNSTSQLTIEDGITHYYMIYSNKIEVSFNKNGGSENPATQSGTVYANSNNIVGATNTINVGMPIEKTTFYKKGYTLDSWNTNSNGSGTSYAPGTVYDFSTSTTLYAQWTPRTDTEYKIQYFKQNSNTLTYSETPTDVETPNPTGTTDTSITFSPNANKYPGYDLDESKQNEWTGKIIAGDGSTTLKVYYKPQTVQYTVKRYFQNSDKTGYDDSKTITETMSGYVDATVSAPETNYDGYELDTTRENEWKNKTIASDGTTVLNVYYNVKKVGYTIKYYYQDGDGNYPDTPRYTDTTGKDYTGTYVEANTTPADAGYDYDSENVNNKVSGNILGDGSLVLKVYFSAKTDRTYTVEHYLMNTEDENYTIVSEDTTIIQNNRTGASVSATPNTYAGYQYYAEISNTSGIVKGDNSLVLKLYYRNEVEITFDLNYNTTPQTSKITLIHGDTYGSALTSPTREGYGFKGWYTDTTYATQVTSSTPVTQACTLYAKWGANEYTLTLNPCGGNLSSTASQITIESGKTYGDYLPELVDLNDDTLKPTKSGYKFQGWYRNSDYSGDAVKAADIVLIADHTLYAKWEEILTLSYNVNATDATIRLATDSPVDLSDKSVAYGELYGDLPILERTGYTFKGWYLTSDNTDTTKIESTDLINQSRSFSLYAHWEANQYTVQFDVNKQSNMGSTPELSTTSKIVTFDDVYGELPTLVAEGYEFKGWYTDATSGTKIESTTQVKLAKDHILHAHWEIKYYTLRIIGVQADGTEEGNTSAVLNAEELDTKFRIAYGNNFSPSAMGIDMNKYKSTVITPKYTYEVNQTQPFIGDLNSPFTADREIQVNYNKTINKYKISFYNWDGSYLGDSDLVEYGNNASDINVNPQKPNDETYSYSFKEWVTTQGGTTKDELLDVKADRNVYASYTPIYIGYEVKFVDDDGTVISDKTDYHYGDVIQVPTAPTKAPTDEFSYHFLGWNDGTKTYTEYELSRETVKTTPVTYTAVYSNSTNQYTVTFYDEDGTTVLGTSTVDYGTDATYTGATPIKDDPSSGYTYSFDMWVKDENRNEKDNLNNVIQNRNVYAHFEATPITYTIQYASLMGADNSSNPTSYTVEDPNIVLQPLANRPGLKFVAWCSDMACTTEITTIETSTKANIVLYAKWEIEALMYFVKENANIDNEDNSVMIYNDFDQAKAYVDTLYDNGNGQALGIYDLNNDLVYYPEVLYYVKDSASIDNANAIEYNDFDEAKAYVDNLFDQGTITRIYDKYNKLVYEPEKHVKLYYIKDDASIDNANAIEYDDFDQAKAYVDSLFNQGTVTRIYDQYNKLVYEPKTIPVEQKVQYFVKVNSTDENTNENTFETFNEAKLKADLNMSSGVKVYDINGDLVYEPTIPEPEPEDLYLKSEKYRIGENNIDEYEDGDVYLYRVNPNTTLEAFLQNCETNGTITIYKQSGAKLKAGEFVGTGMTLRDEKDGKTITLMLSVKGDIDGNGKVTATDLAAMNQQIIKELNLEGAQYMAADISDDKKITATDLAAINQAILKELDLSTIN